MRINLAFDTFSFFKVCVGSLFLVMALFFPIVITFSWLAVIFVGRTHSLGAWLAMWRAGKLNWKYVLWMFFLIVTLSFFGGWKSMPLPVLQFVTYMFFAFHFFFDEVDLQEEKMTLYNAFSSLVPFLIVSLYIIKSFFNLAIGIDMFGVLFILLLIIEFIHIKEIGWLFIQTKILGVFIFCAIFLGIKPELILDIFLMSHYFFWFIFPVYKLHKYKREERDGLIMMLIFIIGTSVVVGLSGYAYGEEALELSIRAFLIGTLVHVLSTPPFGYLFGLPRSRVYSS